MNLRVLSGAIISFENTVLMMKRSENRKLAPGMWAGVGGHSEPFEINSPKATCLREIYEETDLREVDLETLNLKYIILRKSTDEITLMYYFIGHSLKKYFVDKTNEGKLHWIDKNELLNRPMSFEVRSLVKHYLENDIDDESINVGTISVVNEKPIICWNTLDGWNGVAGNL